MSFGKSEHQKHRDMNITEEAAGYVRRMVENETRGWGDQANALSRLARMYRLPFWALNHLRTGRAKTVEAGLFDRIREAFADNCRRHAARLLHEAEMARLGKPNDEALKSLEDEIRALAGRLEAARDKGKT